MPRTRVNFGDFNRRSPFCSRWGATRGGAIDRYYIDRFIKENLRGTRGRYLECGGRVYRQFIPDEGLLTYDVIDSNPQALGVTIFSDLQNFRDTIPYRFDFIICTQVLQYVEAPARAIDELHHVLNPGGTLLLSVPFIEKDFAEMSDRWRFSRRSVAELLGSFCSVHVESRGNLFSSLSYLAGLGLDDVECNDLDGSDDAFYQVVVATAVK